MFRLMEKARNRNNKGFSLVELIVVVLIIAIIAVALAPQVVKYVGKARTNVSLNNEATIKSAVQAAVAEYEGQEGAVVLEVKNNNVAVAVKYDIDTSSNVSKASDVATDAYTAPSGGKSLMELVQANVGNDSLDKSYEVTIKTDSTVTVDQK